jgi:hypothetical protein
MIPRQVDIIETVAGALDELQGGRRRDVLGGDGAEAGENHLRLAQRRLVLVGGFDHGEFNVGPENAGEALA